MARSNGATLTLPAPWAGPPPLPRCGGGAFLARPRSAMNFGFIIINAIVLACIYGTLAISVSITWSSLGLVNLSYGFIFAFAGYGAWVFAQDVSTFGPLVLVAGILTGALGGVIVCLLAFIPIHDKPNFTVRGLIATLAIN